MTRGQGGVGEIVHDIHVSDESTLPGRLNTGKTYILHVEGDREIKVRREMTIEDFAKQNGGNYLVVTVRKI